MISNEDISKMEFEEAIKKLEDIVKILEEGKSTLKESVDLYERGVQLKKHCDSILESVQLRINQISFDKDGVLKQNEVEL
ncbi:MAG: exodeoxyribonuclease VII small subunit [Holosporaceae bacterium]|jgi:exodeoxyribonuclease VII small subunit|nr:exodeoxyribonuclease VII small subunit [Holosporaceae bacterium]